MSARILNCPRCDDFFDFEGDIIPDDITCPTCGETASRNEYSALMLCPSCHKKLNIPLDLLNEPELLCPLCDKAFRTADSLYLSELNTVSSINDFSEEDFRVEQLLKDGEIFDKFRIVRLLGRGGMAEVYLAEHLLFHRQCALKMLTGNAANPVLLKRFVREAKILHEIDHPNIVKVFDISVNPKTNNLFIAMEYIEGHTLASEVQKAPFSEQQLREVLAVLTEALSALEVRNIVHRDIKPSNIMRTPDGSLKLMDLGIAKIDSDAAAGEVTLTMAQSVIGTPGFASPEQTHSSHDTDIRSDIFSIGATLYYLAAGRCPFDGKTAIEIILNTVQKEPIPLDSVRPDLSSGLLNLVRRMMAKSPEDRPAGTAELRKEIALLDTPASQLPAKKTQPPKQKKTPAAPTSGTNRKNCGFRVFFSSLPVL